MAKPVLRTLVIQPTSWCNLNCRYCYVPNRKDKTIMNDKLLQTIIKKSLECKFVQGELEYLWHAGEPLLAGVEFYNRALAFMQEYNERQLKLTNSIQTNGVLINDQWCDLFERGDFEVGLSIDGPSFLHDASRKNWADQSSHKQVHKGYRKLRERNISVAALCVLTNESLKYPDEIFYFFLEEGFTSVAFNVEETENAHQGSELQQYEWETVRDAYSEFMSRMLDLQFKHDFAISIREFSQIAHNLRKKQRNAKHYSVAPEAAYMNIITIQKNGDITPYAPEFAGQISPDFNNFIVGNILDIDIEDIPITPVFKKLESEISQGVHNCASSCRFFDLCGGAFLSNKYGENGDLKSTETLTCKLHLQTLSEVFIRKLTVR